MSQQPFYKSGEREMGAPDGFQPQTQQNNGGPKGLGQPARSRVQASNTPPPRSGPPSQSGPPAPPPFGRGIPGALYAPPAAQADPRANLWANRNSMDPLQLIMTAFMTFQGRAPQQFEIQSLMQSPNVDALTEQLLNLANPGQPSSTQQAILR